MSFKHHFVTFHFSVNLTYSFSVEPRPCLYGCDCYYSLQNQTNIFDCRNRKLTSLPRSVLSHTDELLASENSLGYIGHIEKYIENLSHVDLSNSDVSGISGSVMSSMLKNLKKLNFNR